MCRLPQPLFPEWTYRPVPEASPGREHIPKVFSSTRVCVASRNLVMHRPTKSLHPHRNLRVTPERGRAG